MTPSHDPETVRPSGPLFPSDPGAFQALFQAVYGELRHIARHQLAREPAGHSLRPTELVHEAYLRIAGGALLRSEDRPRFYLVAAVAMRRLLIEHARRKRRLKRGEGRTLLPLDAIQVAVTGDFSELVALDDALERLAALDARLAETFSLRIFAGLTVEETATTLAMSTATVKRDFAVARAWLVRNMSDGPN